MTDASLLLARHAGRPVLMLPRAARDYALRIRALDHRAFSRPGRLGAFLRKVGLAGSAPRPLAMEDDYDAPPPVPLQERLAYAPLWIGDVDDTGFCWSLKDNIALMCADTPLVAQGEEFCGVVYHGYDTLLLAMQEATADERVKGVFLKLSSPGGVVDDGLPQLAAFMRQARAQAGGKPIWVYADMACSAAYWIAAQADKIIAPHVGYVGSIGAVAVHESYAVELAQDGVEITSIEFPDGGEKTDGAYWKPLSPAAQAAWSADVAECGRLFLADVTAGRPSLTEDALLATRAGVFMGDHADPARSGLQLGFVDEIAHEQDAFNALLAEISASPSPKSPSAGPKGSRAAAKSEKEPLMANQPPKKAPKAEKTHAERLAAAEAEVVRLKAQAPDDAPDGDDDGDAADEVDDVDDNSEQPDGGQAPDPSVDEDKPEDKTEAVSREALAIAASAEAKTHPHLALTAISTGMTLAQFQASAATAAPAGRKSPLSEAMANSQRMRPDAKAGGKRESALVANAKTFKG